jgi:hypothetical protein
MILAKASLNYDRSFIVLANGITIVNYDRKTFIVQATGVTLDDCHLLSSNFYCIGH